LHRNRATDQQGDCKNWCPHRHSSSALPRSSTR
jgi:hypothetical protein